MSQEIIDLVRGDKELQQTLGESADKSEAIEAIIAAGAKKGQQYTAADVETALDELSANISTDENLSDQELQQVAGGVLARKPTVYTDAFCCDTNWITVKGC